MRVAITIFLILLTTSVLADGAGKPGSKQPDNGYPEVWVPFEYNRKLFFLKQLHRSWLLDKNDVNHYYYFDQHPCLYADEVWPEHECSEGTFPEEVKQEQKQIPEPPIALLLISGIILGVILKRRV